MAKFIELRKHYYNLEQLVSIVPLVDYGEATVMLFTFSNNSAGGNDSGDSFGSFALSDQDDKYKAIMRWIDELSV